MPVSRRFFLRNAAIAIAGVGTAPLWLARTAFSQQSSGRKKVVVAIFQRGAADGLNMVVPFFEQRYYDLRPAIALPRPGQEDGVLDLDGQFGLHPGLASLVPLFNEQRLAIVHAAGSPDPTRSHFDAQDFMESGTPGVKTTGDGWLNRAMEPGDEASPVRAVAMGSRVPRTLRGANPALAITSLSDFQLQGPLAPVYERMYVESADAQLSATAGETFEAVEIIRAVDEQPGSGVEYPAGSLGSSLEELARLIKADVGLELAFADIGGWDHHTNEGPQLDGLSRQLADSLAAFYQDLGDRSADVVTVTMSEFGRTAGENGNFGTDHGHGNVMLVLGGGVKGGQVYGNWPGLEPEQLNEGRDLAITTDYRDVLGEVLTKHLGASDISQVFPDYEAGEIGLL